MRQHRHAAGSVRKMSTLGNRVLLLLPVKQACFAVASSPETPLTT